MVFLALLKCVYSILALQSFLFLEATPINDNDILLKDIDDESLIEKNLQNEIDDIVAGEGINDFMSLNEILLKDLLTNREYIKNHHEKRTRRIKKVLQPLTLEEIATFYKKNNLRRRRYIDLSSHLYPTINMIDDSSLSSWENFEDSSEAQLSEFQFPNKLNLTKLDLRIFQGAFFSLTKTFCPSLEEKFPNMLQNAQEMILHEIQMAPITQTESQFRKMSLLKELRTCRIKFSTPNFELLTRSQNRFDYYGKIKAFLEKEAKRIIKSSEKEVVPSKENLIKFQKLMIEKFRNFCGDILNEEVRAKVNDVENFLVVLISVEKEKYEERRATFVQNEMEQMIEELKGCIKK